MTSATVDPADQVDTGEARPVAGRPRSKDAERAIVDATLEALVEQGYQAMTIEGIAARAGVGKATIYRRWSDKAQLVVDSVRARGDFSPLPPRTDDLDGDFRAMLDLSLRCMRGSDGALIAAFAAERIRHPELSREFERVCLAERRQRWHELVTDAVDAGRLPADTDVELVTEVGPAMIWSLVNLRNVPVPRDVVARIAAQFFPLTPEPA